MPLSFQSGGGGGGEYTLSGSRASPNNIVAGTGISSSMVGTDALRLVYVQGSGGHVDVTANPQIAAPTSGVMMVIVGRNDDQTVQFDDGTGMSLNGPAVLAADSILGVWFDGTNWVETFRVRC